MDDIARQIQAEVASWDGVTAHRHRSGGVELRFGGRELGYLHGQRVDIPFTRRIRDMLVETGRARSHHLLPDSGWVSRPIESEADVAEAIELFRLAYERAQVAARVRGDSAVVVAHDSGGAPSADERSGAGDV